jgi:hypothetical protein
MQDMHKIVTMAAVIAVAAVAAAWSISTLPRPNLASKAGIEGVPSVAPFDLMVAHGRSLPAESWDAF